MQHRFTFTLEVHGVPVAPITGEAVIIPGIGQPWSVGAIWLNSTGGRIDRVLLTDDWLYARIALHLLNACRAEIDAAWRRHTAKEAA